MHLEILLVCSEEDVEEIWKAMRMIRMPTGLFSLETFREDSGPVKSCMLGKGENRMECVEVGVFVESSKKLVIQQMKQL